MLKQFSNNWQPFFSPEDDTTNNSGPMGKEDVIKFLGEDDDKDEPIILDENKEEEEPEDKPKSKSKSKGESKDKKEKDSKSEESDDDESEESEDEDEINLEDLEDELEEPSEDKLELVTPVRRSTILKKYPTLFKDFPYLEKAYFREQQFTEIFPHPNDAKEALGKAETLDRFETDLFNGNTETILNAVKTETPEAFAKMVDNYMPTLMKVDKEAYHHVIGNTIKQTIMAMVSEGRKINNEALGTAAQILNQFVFGTSDFEPPKNLAVDVKPEIDAGREELKRERQQFARQKFDEARGELNTRVNNSLKATIEANMDPKDTMTPYVKRNAIRDAMETIDNLMDKDTRFKTIVDRLWEKSFKENFSRASTDTIRSAYLSRAKTLLDSVIKKSRNEALKGMGKRVKADDTDETPEKGQRRNKSDNDEPQSKKSGGKSKGVPSGMSTLEFLMSED